MFCNLIIIYYKNNFKIRNRRIHPNLIEYLSNVDILNGNYVDNSPVKVRYKTNIKNILICTQHIYSVSLNYSYFWNHKNHGK